MAKTKTRKRKLFSLDEKRDILAEGLENGIAVTERKYGLYQNCLYTWRKQLRSAVHQPPSVNSNGRLELDHDKQQEAKEKGDVEKEVEKTRRAAPDIRKKCVGGVADVTLRIPAVGTCVKLTDRDGRMIGTLTLTEKGMQYVQANAKKVPDRTLPWLVLGNLMTSGLLDNME